MNYIQELNSFYDWTETNPIPASAINLWHALMQINNKCRWNAEFTAAISTLMAKTGCQRRSIFTARKLLADCGRLKWTSNGSKKAATYQLIPFVPTPTPNNPPCNNKSKKMAGNCTESGTQAAPISKRNTETKQNSHKEPKGSMSSGDDPVKCINNILDDYNLFCKNLPQAKVLTSKRRQMVLARLHEHGYENILVMLRNAGTSNFLAGDNQCQWVATFDWLFRPTNFAKVLEGNYVYNRSAKANKSEFVGKPSPLEIIEEAYNGIINKQDEY